jgi:hypothetical protein
LKYVRARATEAAGSIDASSSGNSPAMKQVTGENWIWAPVPVV